MSGFETLFVDRGDAGAQLGARLRGWGWSAPLVLGMARGGVPVAAGVAKALDAALDVTVARKIGAPGRQELGVGGVTANGPVLYDDYTLGVLELTAEDLESDCERERAEASRRLARYRQVVKPLPLAGRDVIVVDDGLATGVTARAGLADLRNGEPLRLVFAAPVCARSSSAELLAKGVADEVVCLAGPEEFGAVGLWYQHFDQTSDDEVIAVLAEERRAARG